MGCGTGIDTFFLLANGWQVTAIDKEAKAIETIRTQPLNSCDGPENLTTITCPFEEMKLHPVTLINATYLLPFCNPDFFPLAWQQITNALLLPGSRFAGQFFDHEDSWAARSNMTFHSRSDLDDLFTGFCFNHFQEINQEGKTITGKPKRWHVFHIVAQKI